jgi:hypothetical protein
MTIPSNEPNDNHSYGPIWVSTRTVGLIRKAFAHYQRLVEAEVAALEREPELAEAIGDVNSLPLVQEAAQARRIVAWIDSKIAQQDSPNEAVLLSLTHGYVRYTKSVCALYIEYLRERRNALSQRPETSTHLMGSVDAALASFEESMESVPFNRATAVPLRTVDVVPRPEESPKPGVVTIEPAVLPKPVFLSSIEILDAELRGRCVDLFANFTEEGQHDRLDTVVAEATRILETRIRRLAAAPATVVGVELAAYALRGDTPILRVSQVPAEQEAAHLLFRGVFGLIRNHVHHHLTGQMSPQRVLQILGLIDYLIWLSETAEVSDKN